MPDPKPKGRPPERLIVTINFKMALATPAEVETVTWPKGWPLPQPGDIIKTETHTGFFVNASFDLKTGRVVLNTR